MSALTVTVFPDNKSRSIQSAQPMSLIEVERLIRAVPPAPKKSALPLLKLAEFGSIKTDAGCLRHDANVTVVTGIEGDYDGESMPMAEAAKRLNDAGVAALLYTSASHEDAAPRWRVLCPLSRTLVGTPVELREQRRRLVGVLDAILGGVLTPESSALSQSFYFGRIEGRPDPAFLHTTGLCIDELRNPPEPDFQARSPTARMMASLTAPPMKNCVPHSLVAKTGTSRCSSCRPDGPREAWLQTTSRQHY